MRGIMFCSQYLLHGGVSAGQLLPEIRHVMVELLHVLFEVFPEYQQRLFHFTLKLKHIRVLDFRKLQETKAKSKKYPPTPCLFIASVSEMHIRVYVQ